MVWEGITMALFNKEPERNLRPEPQKPQLQPQAHPQPAPAYPPNGPTVVAVNTPPVEPVPAPPARALETKEQRAYLDSGSRISGKLAFDGPIRIDGHVDGEINAKDILTIGESAVVTAQIRAGSIIVAGKVSGDIIAAQRIEIRTSAKVLGNLTAPVLVVHEGAMFEGHCSMQSEAIREDRKVTVFPKEDRPLQAAGGQKQG
jgi:cytoskeletal protein CcmA (bactofilin family)